MSTAITLADLDDLDTLVPLLQRHDEERRRPAPASPLEDTVRPLLEGQPHGAIWLIGPHRSPLGYVLVTFGWSRALGGREAWLDEIFIRPSVRNRGIAKEVTNAITVSLAKAGLKAFHARVDIQDVRARKFCEKLGWKIEDQSRILTDFL